MTTREKAKAARLRDKIRRMIADLDDLATEVDALCGEGGCDDKPNPPPGPPPDHP